MTETPRWEGLNPVAQLHLGIMRLAEKNPPFPDGTHKSSYTRTPVTLVAMSNVNWKSSLLLMNPNPFATEYVLIVDPEGFVTKLDPTLASKEQIAAEIVKGIIHNYPEYLFHPTEVERMTAKRSAEVDDLLEHLQVPIATEVGEENLYKRMLSKAEIQEIDYLVRQYINREKDYKPHL